MFIHVSSGEKRYVHVGLDREVGVYPNFKQKELQSLVFNCLVMISWTCSKDVNYLFSLPWDCLLTQLHHQVCAVTAASTRKPTQISFSLQLHTACETFSPPFFTAHLLLTVTVIAVQANSHLRAHSLWGQHYLDLIYNCGIIQHCTFFTTWIFKPHILNALLNSVK